MYGISLMAGGTARAIAVSTRSGSSHRGSSLRVAEKNALDLGLSLVQLFFCNQIAIYNHGQTSQFHPLSFI